MNLFKKCESCNRDHPIIDFMKVRCKFFPGGIAPICNDCIDLMIKNCRPEDRWDKVNKLCQWVDVPFIPEEWEKIWQGVKSNWLANYCKVFSAREFDGVSWLDYNKEYIQLHQTDELMDEVPGYQDKKYEMLMKKWGSYDRDDLDRLEQLFNETIATQNVTTGNQIDQVKKICKTSLLIDQRINENQPYKDLMDSYEKLIKVADLTPKNTKNSNDFDSVGELYEYLEYLGWVNKWYDGAKRDEVDETMKNVQNWIRRLCIGESTMTEDILQKLNNISSFNENDATDYDSFDYDEYERDATTAIQEQQVEVNM